MKYVMQFCIIIGISFVGELLHTLLPLPVPGSIYGLLILFAALMTGILKTRHVKEVSGFFLSIMPLLFVPSSVSFINAFPLMKKYGLQFFGIALVTTLIVMVVTGHVTQLVMKITDSWKKKNKDCE